MTRDEAIRAAEAFVTRKYSHVPPVVGVTHLTTRGRLLAAEHWFRGPDRTHWRESSMAWDESKAADAGFRDEWRTLQAAGHETWTVSFFMSWDTDALGMPQTLQVRINDADGAVSQITPE
jgi:hypothetical protein